MSNALVPPPVGVSTTERFGGVPPTQTTGGLFQEKPTVKLRRPSRLKNLAGLVFGRLTVLHLAGLKPTKWVCQCSCGKTKTIAGSSLVGKITKSCGCLSKELTSARNRKNLTGGKFGRLLVVKSAGVSQKQQQKWECVCDCGAVHVVLGYNLTSGAVSSCGCYRKERTTQTCFNFNLSVEEREARRLRGPKTRPEAEALAQYQLSRNTFVRDNYTCLACGERGGALAAHHIQPWALYPGLRRDAANLITLCKKCHSQFHYLYGNDADLDDFEDYLKP